MVITSTYFESKNIHKGSWVSPDGNTINQIDHVVVDTRHYSDVMNVRTRRGANIDFDHYLVQAKLRVRISNTKKGKGSKEDKFEVDRLRNPEIVRKFEHKLTEKLEDQLSSTVKNNYWNMECENILKEVATTALGKKKQERKGTEWYDAKCAEGTQKKNQSYAKLQNRRTRQNQEKYKQMRQAEKKIIKQKKTTFIKPATGTRKAQFTKRSAKILYKCEPQQKSI
ncbi:uncharacterized protein [Diabrotica undecimpunctata]|uniref:uncharacterized protein n=1 Tax=Diabrotica undecimpunctata TaxID=50387 RepID=UPI003B641594